MDKDRLKSLVAQGHTILQAAEILGVSYSTAYKTARGLGLNVPRAQYAHLHDEWRRAYEGGLSIRQIAKAHNVSTMAVRGAIRGLARSFTRQLGRPDYFAAIDTSEKAYWLGLLWADGNVNDRRAGQQVVQISLTQHDGTDPKENELGLLETLRLTLETDYALGSRRSRKDTGDVLHLALVSDQLANDLFAHGLIPRKGENKLGPTPVGVADAFVPAFARGLLDGDGTMYLNTRKNSSTGHVSWAIQPRWTGGYNVLEWLAKRLAVIGLIEAPIKPQYGNATCFIYLAPNDARKVIKAMYDAPGPSLRRKREKAMSMITDLHPQDWQDYEGEPPKLPPRVQTPLTFAEAGRKGAASRWGADSVEVIHGDAFKLLPKMEEKSVDLVLTDFPYGEASRKRGKRKWHFGPFTYEQTKRALTLCGRISRSWVIVATMDIAVIGQLRDDCPEPLRFVRISTWEKEDYFRPGGDAEYIGFFRRKGVADDWFPPAVFKFKSNGHSGHPCSKPDMLYAELIKAVTEVGNIVLDPFCGSGTVGRAAILAGRRAVLIDKEEEYVQMAERSLKQ